MTKIPTRYKTLFLIHTWWRMWLRFLCFSSIIPLVHLAFSEAFFFTTVEELRTIISPTQNLKGQWTEEQCQGDLLLVCLPADNVQNELQR